MSSAPTFTQTLLILDNRVALRLGENPGFATTVSCLGLLVISRFDVTHLQVNEAGHFVAECPGPGIATCRF